MIFRLHFVWLGFLSLCLGLAGARAQSGVTAFLEPEDLGNLPGYNSSSVIAVSPDGTAVFGYGFNMTDELSGDIPGYRDPPLQFFRWTPSTGPVAISPVYNRAFSHVADISDNGNTFVGWVDTDIQTQVPTDGLVLWTEAGGWATLPGLSGFPEIVPLDVSADGSTIVGFCQGTGDVAVPFQWKADEGTVALPVPPGHEGVRPFWVSQDGAIIYGSSPSGMLVRWATNGVEVISTPAPDSGTIQYGYSVSTDGRMIAGIVQTNHIGIRLTDSNQQIVLSPEGAPLGESLGVRQDGSGVSFLRSSNSGPDVIASWWDWTPALGTRLISESVMPNRYELNHPPRPVGIASPDGSTLLMQATHWDPTLNYDMDENTFGLQRGPDTLEQLVFPPAVYPHVPFPFGRQHMSRDGSVIAGNGRIAEPCDPIFSCYIPLYRRAYRWVSTSGFVVRDVSRTGNPIGALPGVTVRLTLGNQTFATNTTDAGGRAQFSAEQVDPDELYDVELELGGLRRTYANVRPSEVASGQVKLALPVTIWRLLDQQLTALETTGALVLSYDTGAANALLTQWNTDAREEVALHTSRDQALGRLLTAVEGLATLYGSAEPLAMDSGKMVAGTILAIMSYQKALSELNDALAAQAANADNLVGHVRIVAAFCLDSVALSMKFAADQARDAFILSTKKSLPPWASTLVDQSIAAATEGVTSMIADGGWDKTKGSSGARRALLEGAIDVLGEQVGGRILASAYVAVTESNLAYAVNQSTAQAGSGTVAAGYTASQDRVIAATERNTIALDASATVAKVTKQVGYLADASIVVGKAGFKAVSVLGRALKLLNIVATGGAAANDLDSLYQTGFNDAPVATQRAYFPPAPGSRALRAAAAGSGGSGGPAPAALVPETYTNQLALLADAVAADDWTNALAHGQALFAGDPDLTARLQAEALRIATLLELDPARAGLRDASGLLQQASVAAGLDRANLYLLLAHYLVPEFTEPLDPPAEIHSQLLAALSTYRDTLQSVEDAVAYAAAEAAGLVAPPALAVLDHGLHPDSIADTAVPGPVEIHARVINLGDSAAEDVTVTLTPGTNDGPVAIFRLTNDPVRAVGTLAAGAATTLVWNGLATDISTSGVGSAAFYDIGITALTGTAAGASGGFTVAPEPATFVARMTNHPGAGTLTNFTDDADGDDAANGAELYFGTDPLLPDAAFLQIEETTPILFSHPRNARPPTDVEARYEWSDNLTNWHGAGPGAGSQHVSFQTAVVEGEGGEVKTIQVAPFMTGFGDGPRYFRLKLLHQPETPVVPTPPEILVQPADQSVFEGETVTLSVEAAGDAPLLYSWYRNGVLLEEAIDASLVFTNATSAQSGTYHVRILNPGGTATSSNATVDVSSGGGGD